LDRIEELIADLDAIVDSRYRLAVDGLVEVGGSAVQPLCRALTDSSECRRSRAAEALGRLRRREALPVLRERLRTIGGERAAQVRPRIWAAIMRIENASASIGGRPRAGEADVMVPTGRPRPAAEALEAVVPVWGGIDMPGVTA
jgi:hypothetical protein